MVWSVRDRVCVVTGANAGIGRVTALELARAGARVVIAGRSRERSILVLQEIEASTARHPARFVALDLASLTSVREAAERIRRDVPVLAVLVNNAGVAGFRGRTIDGYELAFGVNHLGHYLLTRLLLPSLLHSPPARIINVASQAHYQAKGIDWGAVERPTETFTGLREYERSKLANVLFTRALARRHPSVASYAVHPGTVASSIWKRIPQPVRWLMMRQMISNEEGARGSLHLATASDILEPSGSYFHGVSLRSPNPRAMDEGAQRELWEQSARLVGWTAEDEGDTRRAGC